MIIFNKFSNYFFVSAERQTFLAFEMTAHLRDTSPLTNSQFGYVLSMFVKSFVNLSLDVLTKKVLIKNKQTNK